MTRRERYWHKHNPFNWFIREHYKIAGDEASKPVELAELIHNAMCDTAYPKSVNCPWWTSGDPELNRHQAYYRDRASVLMDALEPIIGGANVPTVVLKVIDALW